MNPFWEDHSELRWFQACHLFSRALAALVPDSARFRRCDGWMRRAVELACAASDRHSLGLPKPRHLAIHHAASIVGRHWRGRWIAPNSRIRGGLRRAWNRCDLRWRRGWEAFPVPAPAGRATLYHCHWGGIANLKEGPSFGFEQFDPQPFGGNGHFDLIFNLGRSSEPC
jgi:hypothetical protein